MEAKHIQDIMEVYSSIYAQQEQEVLSEEVEQLDEITASMGRRAKKYREDQAQAAHMQSLEKHQENMKNPEYRERHERLRQTHSRKEDQKESFDLFDTILEYLVAEGYADTNKAALAIMANMSEEWKQSIIEGVGGYDDPFLGPDTPGGKMVRKVGQVVKGAVSGAQDAMKQK